MNLAISRIGETKIIYFLKDCIRKGNTFIGGVGSSTRYLVCKPESANLVWTEDDVLWSYDGNNLVCNKTISELTLSVDSLEIENIIHSEVTTALGKLKQFSSKSYSDVNTYVDSNPPVVVMKMYGNLLLGLTKIVFKILK